VEVVRDLEKMVFIRRRRRAVPVVVAGFMEEGIVVVMNEGWKGRNTDERKSATSSGKK
jgi:hypothetical protein